MRQSWRKIINELITRTSDTILLKNIKLYYYDGMAPHFQLGFLFGVADVGRVGRANTTLTYFGAILQAPHDAT